MLVETIQIYTVFSSPGSLFLGKILKILIFIVFLRYSLRFSNLKFCEFYLFKPLNNPSGRIFETFYGLLKYAF